MTPNQRKLEHYQAANLDAAAFILADRVKYPAGSLSLHGLRGSWTDYPRPVERWQQSTGLG